MFLFGLIVGGVIGFVLGVTIAAAVWSQHPDRRPYLAVVTTDDSRTTETVHHHHVTVETRRAADYQPRPHPSRSRQPVIEAGTRRLIEK